MGAARRRRRADHRASRSRGGSVRPGFSGGALWVYLLLIVANVVIYVPVWSHHFLDMDDPAYISENPQVAAGLTWQGLVWAFTTGHADNWHPLTWLSHMLDVQLFGVTPGPHHLTNVVLHIANTLLLFGLLHRMTGQVGRSAVVAGLFGVHPLHVESVAWVAERKDVLSTLFGLLTLWGYVAYVRQPRVARYLVVVLLLALGLMAKPMLVTLPFVLLLLDFWPLGRLAGGAGTAGRPESAALIDPRSALKVVWEKVPLLGLTLASSIVTFVAQQRGGAVIGFEVLPLGQRVANALVSYVAYIGKMLWPTRLAVIYPYPHSLPIWWVIGSLLGLIGVSVLVIRAARRAPYLPVGWLWYLGTLVPVIGLVQVGIQSMAADRYTYVPLIGLFIILAWGIPDLLTRWSYRHIALPIGAGLVLVACSITASVQVQYWKNRTALWERAVDVTKGNYLAHNNLGNVLAQMGKTDEAIAHYAEALRIKPGLAEAHNNLGFTLAGRGRADEAMTHYAEALRIKPDYVEARSNLGVALATQGRVDEAIQELREALRMAPNDAEVHANLAEMFVRKGQVTESARHYSEAIRLNPGDPDTHFRLGLILADQGKLEDAARHFEAAVTLNPRFQRARQALDDLTSRRSRSGLGTR
jgi:Tfp pilus assembly protein PilF